MYYCSTHNEDCSVSCVYCLNFRSNMGIWSEYEKWDYEKWETKSITVSTVISEYTVHPFILIYDRDCSGPHLHSLDSNTSLEQPKYCNLIIQNYTLETVHNFRQFIWDVISLGYHIFGLIMEEKTVQFFSFDFYSLRSFIVMFSHL